MAFGLNTVAIIRKSRKTMAFDSFVYVKILETIRQEFSYDFFHAGQLVSALNVNGVPINILKIQQYLKVLVLKRYLKSQDLPFMWKTRMSTRPHYAFGKKSRQYLEKWVSFTNPEGLMFKQKQQLLEKVRNGSAIIT